MLFKQAQLKKLSKLGLWILNSHHYVGTFDKSCICALVNFYIILYRLTLNLRIFKVVCATSTQKIWSFQLE